jgi:3-(3-hydroxy-phenyl)propionate hydroxylase
MTDGTFDADVVVIGLGPVGAVASLLLNQTGLRVAAIERSLDIFPLPRAAHVDHEVMRVFQQIGIIDAIGQSIRAAASYEFRAANGDALLRFEFDPSSSPSGWASGYMIHQPGIERALHAAIDESPIQARRGVVLSAIKQDATGVTVTLDTGDMLRARYVVGCDGASSAVREAVGIGLEDLRFDEPWLVIDALIDRADLLPDLNLQLCDPARPTTCVLMPAGRHRWEFMLLPGETEALVLDEAFIADLLTPWGVTGHVRIERKAVYHFHGLLADRWRKDRVMLAGDAAHQMPPFAGQGFCSGVRDAANLAWKLAAVVHGHASDAVLDSYESERAPHVRAYVDLAIAMGRVVCILDPAAAAARDDAMRARRAAGGSGLPPLQPPALGPGLILSGSRAAGSIFPQPWSRDGDLVTRLDDVLADGAWLIRRDGGSGELDAAGVSQVILSDPAIAPLRGPLLAWLDEQQADAVLVRADRYVFGTGAADVLADAYARALGRNPKLEEVA